MSIFKNFYGAVPKYIIVYIVLFIWTVNGNILVSKLDLLQIFCILLKFAVQNTV